MPDRPTKTEKVNTELILYRLDEIKTQQTAMNDTLSKLNTVYVPRSEITDKFKVVHDRVDDLESNQKWVVRGILGAFLSAVAAFFISGNK